jgi:microcystin-dependent protein
MATKKITDLQLRSDFSETCNIPVDDTIQTFRCSGAQLAEFIKEYGEHTGVIKPYGGDTAPAGYLMCDGTSYLRASYPNLFSGKPGSIGTKHGAVDSTHFNVPDYRGLVLRGANNGKVTGLFDPDASARTAMSAGGATGDSVGSVQDHQYKSHKHDVSDTGHGHSASTNYNYAATNKVGSSKAANGSYYAVDTGVSIGTGYASISETSKGGNETRMMNAYCNYIIKI